MAFLQKGQVFGKGFDPGCAKSSRQSAVYQLLLGIRQRDPGMAMDQRAYLLEILVSKGKFTMHIKAVPGSGLTGSNNRNSWAVSVR
ncbi:MAG: hypothetical protein ABII81_07465 [Pseudomonadota bacterium]